MWCDIDHFVEKVFEEATRGGNPPPARISVVKRHKNNFEKFGEFSFPKGARAWGIPGVPFEEGRDLDKACGVLVEKSQEWPLRIDRCVIVNDRVHIFLDRLYCLRLCLSDFTARTKRTPLEVKRFRITVQDGAVGDLSHFRMRSLGDLLGNVIKFKGHVVSEWDEDVDYNIRITGDAKSSSDLCIFSAPVLNCVTGVKEVQIKTDEYITKRTTDMKLKALHKYRVTVIDEEAWNESLVKLGVACAKFDLLQIKPSHPMNLNMMDGGNGRSKGASFILYNAARLSSIIRTYDENVKRGVYLPLPPAESVNFKLLDDEDEWIIVFNYILDFPTVIEKCLSLESNSCVFSPHVVCSYLDSLVGVFSIYYRRVRVLLEPREHLMPKIFARMHLLRAILAVIEQSLSLLDVEVLSEM